jgi:competence ComEA-like helix-hairpin-helix protein
MKKWQIFVIGILCGLVFSGLCLLIEKTREPAEIAYISPTYSESTKYGGINGISQAKLNINTASIEELDTLPGIGVEKASAIVDFREKNGKFMSIEDLLYVPGIGQAILDQIEDKITVE